MRSATRRRGPLESLGLHRACSLPFRWRGELQCARPAATRRGRTAEASLPPRRLFREIRQSRQLFLRRARPHNARRDRSGARCASSAAFSGHPLARAHGLLLSEDMRRSWQCQSTACFSAKMCGGPGNARARPASQRRCAEALALPKHCFSGRSVSPDNCSCGGPRRTRGAGTARAPGALSARFHTPRCAFPRGHKHLAGLQVEPAGRSSPGPTHRLCRPAGHALVVSEAKFGRASPPLRERSEVRPIRPNGVGE
jgi:hypothetical protein